MTASGLAADFLRLCPSLRPQRAAACRADLRPDAGAEARRRAVDRLSACTDRSALRAVLAVEPALSVEELLVAIGFRSLISEPPPDGWSRDVRPELSCLFLPAPSIPQVHVDYDGLPLWAFDVVFPWLSLPGQPLATAALSPSSLPSLTQGLARFCDRYEHQTDIMAADILASLCVLFRRQDLNSAAVLQSAFMGFQIVKCAQTQLADLCREAVPKGDCLCHIGSCLNRAVDVASDNGDGGLAILAGVPVFGVPGLAQKLKLLLQRVDTTVFQAAGVPRAGRATLRIVPGRVPRARFC